MVFSQTNLKKACPSEDHEMQHTCRECGASASSFNANPALLDLRPEADGFDYWAACDNIDCQFSYGAGYYADGLPPLFLIYEDKRFEEPDFIEMRE